MMNLLHLSTMWTKIQDGSHNITVTVTATHDISLIRYLCRIQNEHCYSLKLTKIKTKLWEDLYDVDI